MSSRLLTRATNVLMITMMAAMVALVFGNVVLRYAFNAGLVFSEEASRFVFMWLTLIGAVLVLKDNMHLGMSTIVARLGLRGQQACRFVADLGALGCCLLLLHGGWKLAVIAMDDRAPVTGIPLGLVYGCLVVSSAAMAALLVHSLWRLLSGRMPRSELVRDTAGAGE